MKAVMLAACVALALGRFGIAPAGDSMASAVDDQSAPGDLPQGWTRSEAGSWVLLRKGPAPDATTPKPGQSRVLALRDPDGLLAHPEWLQYPTRIADGDYFHARIPSDLHIGIGQHATYVVLGVELGSLVVKRNLQGQVNRMFHPVLDKENTMRIPFVDGGYHVFPVPGSGIGLKLVPNSPAPGCYEVRQFLQNELVRQSQ